MKDLRAALKDASELYLATDEDREGEAISWHLLEYLKPKMPVKRMVFHEITKSAIDHAVDNPRGIDYGLVDAAETRRLLDRLYGYEVSPVLWRRVNRGLSAGRVQSPSVRLIVERERERIAFVAAGYWDIELLTATAPRSPPRSSPSTARRSPPARTSTSDGRASRRRGRARRGPRRGRSPTRSRAADSRSARSRRSRTAVVAAGAVHDLAPCSRRAAASCASASQVMRVAQGLYERGYITYMRTDNVMLCDEALRRRARRGRSGVRRRVPVPGAAAVHHEGEERAGGPRGDPARPRRCAPDQVAGELNGQELSLYRMIWQRTLASQMADATGITVSVRLGRAARGRTARDAEFAARGTTITFPGYRQVYVESRRRRRAPTTSARRCCRRSPSATRCRSTSLDPEGHATSPPARYTEASLVKRLEELGIGRPSTWASIIQTIQDRGYVWKKGQALVPTWTAFAVVGLLEQHFDELVDYAFTARIEETSTRSPAASARRTSGSSDFYFGDDDDDLPGLKRLVEENLDEIDAAEINTFPIGLDADGNEIVVKPGKYGPYVKRGDDTASVPDDLAPDELTVDWRSSCWPRPKSDEPIGELDGLPVFAKNGRYGPYVQWGTADDRRRGSKAEDGEPVQDDGRSSGSRSTRPRRCSLPRTSAPTRPTAWRSSPTTAATGRT